LVATTHTDVARDLVTSTVSPPEGRPPAGAVSAGDREVAPGIAQPQGLGGERARDALAIAVPALLAAGLCLIDITARSLGFDEGASVTIASQHGGALGSAIAHDGGNMSGYYLLLHVLIGAFGNGLFVLRAASVVADAAGVAVIAAIALVLFGRRQAWVAGLLAAVSLPLVFWGQSARGYAPMVLFASGSFLALIAIVEAHGTRRRRRSWWLIYVVLITLGVYSSFMTLLVVPAQLLALALTGRRRAAAGLLGALAAVAALSVPLLVLALGRGSGQLFWVPTLSHTVDKQVFESLTSAGLQPVFHKTAVTSVLLGLTVAALLAVAIVIVRDRIRGASDPRMAGPDPRVAGPDLRVAGPGLRVAGPDLRMAGPDPRMGGPDPRMAGPGLDRRAWGQILIAAWFVVPVGLAFVESIFGQPIFEPRNLLTAVPAVSLLLAIGITDPRLPRALAWTAFVVVLALRALALAPSYGTSPEEWRGATAYVLARAQPRDCVAFYPSDGRMAFQYYVGGGDAAVRAPRSILPATRWGVVRTYVEDYAGLTMAQISRLPGRCPRVWLVSSHEGQPNGPAGSKVNYHRFIALRAALERAYAGHQRTKLGYAAVIRVELLSN
jgi:Dolichyl-phosphate-mannose-protein mannosyltransferase